MKVSVRELKNRISEYLRRAGAGERIVVTSHGKPVATLVSATDDDALTADVERAVERFEELPWVIPAKRPGKPVGTVSSPSVPEGTAEEVMDWVRGE